MLLGRLILENIGIYDGVNEFDLSAEPGRPIVLCGGKNGAGKTTIFESILLCLYGKKYLHDGMTENKYQQKIMRLLHRRGRNGTRSETASMTLVFRHAHLGGASEYEVRRAWENDGGRASESLTVRKRGGSGDTLSGHDAQYAINDMLPAGITRFFFFNGEQIEQMAGRDGHKHVKPLLHSLFGLDVVDQLYADIGTHIRRNSNSELAGLLEEMVAHKKKKDELEERMGQVAEKQAFLDGEVERGTRELSALEERFRKLGGTLAQRRVQMAEDRAKLESSIERTKGEIRQECAGLLPLRLVPSQLEEVRSGLESDAKTLSAASERKILSDAFDDVSQRIRDVDLPMKDDFVRELDAIMSERLEAVPDRRPVFGFSARDTKPMVAAIESAAAYDAGRLDRLCKMLDEDTEKLDALKESLSHIPQHDEIGPLLSETIQAGRILEDQKDEIENLKNIEARLQSELVLLNSTIRKCLGKKKAYMKKRGGLDIAPRVQAALAEYSAGLKSERIKSLERNILEGMRRLLHKDGFVERVCVDPDTFEVTLYDSAGDEIPREVLSNGELQVYATAIMWGLALTSGRSMPFVIDTPLARLDMSHRENFVRWFYPEASHQVIILSTDSEITEQYYRQMRPHMSREMRVGYEPGTKASRVSEGYFFEGEVIEA